MKRMITAITVLAASAAFAAPANASVATDAEAWAPCRSGEDLGTCAKRIVRDVTVSTSPSVHVCYSGESVDECLERIYREADPVGDVFAAIRTVGAEAGKAIVLVRDTADRAMQTVYDACDDVISTCDPTDFPLLP